MVLTADQQRVKALLTETITLLCKNGLHFKSKFCIEGLIGITLDGDDVFLVSINETVRAHFDEAAHQASQSSSQSIADEQSFVRKNNRKRRKSSGTPDHVLQLRPDHSDRANCLEEAAEWPDAPNQGALSGIEQLPTVKSETVRSESALYSSNGNSLNELNASNEIGGTSDSLRVSAPHTSRSSWNEFVGHSELSVNVTSGDADQKIPEQLEEPVSKRRIADDSVSDSEIQNKHSQIVRARARTDRDGTEREDNQAILIKEETASDDDISHAENSFTGYLNMYGLDAGEGVAASMIASSGKVPPQMADVSLPGCSSWNRRTMNRRPASPNSQQQVELVPGSGVYISYATHLLFEQDQTIKGSKLVRRLVHELFPDERVLATSSCLGKRQGASHTGLDQQKVDAIKAFVQRRLPHMSHSKIVLAINECCRDARTKLRRLIYREWSAKATSMQ